MALMRRLVDVLVVDIGAQYARDRELLVAALGEDGLNDLIRRDFWAITWWCLP